MFKKTICILLSVIMFVSTSPVVAADNAPSVASVGELLIDHHRRSRAAAHGIEINNAFMKKEHKRVLRIAGGIAVALLIVMALLYYVPWPEPVSLSVQGTKLDAQGNVIRTLPVRMEGSYVHYLFREDRLVLEFTDVDGLKQTGSDPAVNEIRTKEEIGGRTVYVPAISSPIRRRLVRVPK